MKREYFISVLKLIILKITIFIKFHFFNNIFLRNSSNDLPSSIVKIEYFGQWFQFKNIVIHKQIYIHTPKLIMSLVRVLELIYVLQSNG